MFPLFGAEKKKYKESLGQQVKLIRRGKKKKKTSDVLLRGKGKKKKRN
jgi:hypothetical protein